VLLTIARVLLPANVDIYLSPVIKTTLISGRNLSDISTVVGRAVTASTREGLGWPRPAPPGVPASWHYTLEALESPSRLTTFHASRIQSLAAGQNQTETFFS
jgi:hypothetical protein